MFVFVLQLKKQAEITAAQQAAIEAKERAEAERKAKRQGELAEVCASDGSSNRHSKGRGTVQCGAACQWKPG